MQAYSCIYRGSIPDPVDTLNLQIPRTHFKNIGKVRKSQNPQILQPWFQVSVVLRIPEIHFRNVEKVKKTPEIVLPTAVQQDCSVLRAPGILLFGALKFSVFFGEAV